MQAHEITIFNWLTINLTTFFFQHYVYIQVMLSFHFQPIEMNHDYFLNEERRKDKLTNNENIINRRD